MSQGVRMNDRKGVTMKLESDSRRFLRTILENLTVEFVICGKGTVPPDWGQRCLVRNYIKLYFYEGGEGFVEFDGIRYEPGPGTFLLIPEGVEHSFETVSENPYTKYYCHYNARIGSMNLFDLIDCQWSIALDEKNRMEARKIFESLYSLRNSADITRPLREKSLLLRLTTLFLGNTEVERIHQHSESLERMKTASDYIQTHLAEDITVEGLSAMFGLHPNYFSLVFKKTFGVPPVKYISQTRLEEARKLLITTDMTIGEIAEATGFLNVHYFSTTFKKHYDISPSGYRKMAI